MLAHPGVRLDARGNLVVPMHRDGAIVGLARIAPDGAKRYAKGSKKTGAAFVIGRRVDGSPIVVAEGYATGASIHEATGLLCVIAFDAGNTGPVARTVRAKRPDARIIIAADDDCRTPGNPGIAAANAAARAVGGLVAIPSFGDARPDGASDFNDLRNALGDDAVRGMINAASAPTAEPTPGQPSAAESAPLDECEIVIRDGEMPAAVDAALAALAASGDVFARGGRGGTLVRVVDVRTALAEGLRVRGDDATQRDDAQALTLPLAPNYLRTRLERTASVVRFVKDKDSNEWMRVRTSVPLDLARRILEDGDFAGVPALHAIATAPFPRADGSICEREGYDAASGVLLRAGALRVAPVAARPTLADATAARDALLEPFAEFKFSKEAHRAVVAAAILSLLTRHLLPTVPPIFASAPVAGSGKTLIVDCIVAAALGIAPAKRNFPVGDEAELRKMMHAALLVGDPVIALDNLPAGHAVASATLCAITTADMVADRVLGKSEAPRLRNGASVFLTGNNIMPRGDLVRRSLVVEIDPDDEHPENRTFRVADLRAHVRARRPALVHAALTILRGFVVAGAPGHGKPALGSFEAWDSLVRAACLWVGLADPLDTQADVRASDDDAAAAVALLGALRDAFLSAAASFTVAEVRARLARDIPGQPSELGEAVVAACPRGVEGLGHWLRAHRGQRRGRYRLRQAGMHSAAVRWAVEAS